LLDGTYRQFYFDEQFREKLNAGLFDRGLVARVLALAQLK